MPEFPIMPTDTGALLGDTLHLSAAEFGAYTLMIIIAWRTKDGALPADDKYLARITRLGKRWHRHKATLLAFWTAKDGQLYQKRIGKERDRLQQRPISRSKLAANSSRKSLKSNNVVFLEPTNSIPIPKESEFYKKARAELKAPLRIRASPLTESAIEEVRRLYPGYDIRLLEQQWLAWTDKRGGRGNLRNPYAAFLAFARRHAERNRWTVAS